MKKVILVGILLGIIFCLTACQQETTPSESTSLQIVTSFYPMYIATSNIVEGVPDVVLTNMTKPEVGCLHDYQLTTKDMNLLERADIFVINGGGMESFLTKAMNAYPSLTIVNASEGILEEHEEEGHHHEEENAHVWVSISLYIEQVKNIAHDLATIDVAHQEQYEANAKRYIEELEALKEEMHEALDALPHRNIVTFHEAFTYFAEEFDLQVVGVIEREPGTSPSAGELSQIIEKMKTTDTSAIFVEPQYDPGIARVISQETNIPVYSLDPIVTGDMTKDAYETLMRKNLNVLEEALQ